MEFKAHKQEHDRLQHKLRELEDQLAAVYRTNKRLRQLSVDADPVPNDSPAPQTTRFETPQKQF